jgi:hypothetical protein
MYTFLHTYMDIRAYMYIYLCVVKILFRFVEFFKRNFAETKRYRALAKRNFGENSFRDETEKVYFGETVGSPLLLLQGGPNLSVRSTKYPTNVSQAIWMREDRVDLHSASVMN